MSRETIPDLDEAGADWVFDLGEGRALLGYVGQIPPTGGSAPAWDHCSEPAAWTGRTRFAHICDRGNRGVIRCAPALQAAHTVTGTGQGPTVSPSILCPDCGTHGFVRDGRWLAVLPEEPQP